MTNALERAFQAASSLPEAAQDALAAAILEEIGAEERWSRAFSQHSRVLERLAEEALADEAAGRTEPFDPDTL